MKTSSHTTISVNKIWGISLKGSKESSGKYKATYLLKTVSERMQ
jgi:hypothetical protein